MGPPLQAPQFSRGPAGRRCDWPELGILSPGSDRLVLEMKDSSLPSWALHLLGTALVTADVVSCVNQGVDDCATIVKVQVSAADE